MEEFSGYVWAWGGEGAMILAVMREYDGCLMGGCREGR